MMRIGCIQVLYNPDLAILRKSIEMIFNQIDEICLIDNSIQSSNVEQLREISPKIKIISLGKNTGIAKAQNIGIEYFIKKSVDYILFLDQDSIPPTNLISQLISDYNLLISKNIHVGGIGPRAINRQDNKAYKGLIKKGKNITEDITEVGEIISSSSFIPIENFEKVGLMEEELFIDGVDHEWCWRARHVDQLRFFISEKALLSHQLGEGDRSILIKKIAIPTPFRTYFQFRNYFILLKKPYVPLYWKLSNGFKYSIKAFYYPLFIKPRVSYLKNIIKGIRDGIGYLFTKPTK